MNDPQLGQRWISENETELGLGIVVDCDLRTVTLLFPGSEESRVYARKSAPLARFIKQAGDHVEDEQGRSWLITGQKEQHGIIVYEVRDEDGQNSLLPETRLGHIIHLHQAQERLLSGQLDSLELFQLRHELFQLLQEHQHSPARGLLGARIDLLPHQIDVAHTVGQRQSPRVLLADEVGLGKTIEAGLILHQQLHAGWIRRCLILVPENLQHQWLVELLRRFNLNFSLFDSQRLQDAPGDNPFESEQLILLAQETLLASSTTLEQALAAGFDMLIVDEAHHLVASAAYQSPAYIAVARLAEACKSVLLLTATPEQLGIAGHFARLHLLDPQRFPSLAALLEEASGLQKTAVWADALNSPEPLPAEILAPLQAALPDFDLATADAAGRQSALDALIDRHGTGRLLFRNTRQAVGHFPARQLHIHAIDPAAPCLDMEHNWPREQLREDARLRVIVTLLRSLRREKTLLICHHRDAARHIEEHLRLHEGIRTSMFHEDMSLLERDRAAAYFSDQESGAQVLICSEIGSEGRNFQWASHLVLFDLPQDPDLLEQRIGRLDRIGQKHTIQIHVFAAPEQASARQVDWYHRGLNAFEHSCKVGQALYAEFKDRLVENMNAASPIWEPLIAEVQARRQELELQLEKGRDRLLELSSCRPARVAPVLAALQDADADPRLQSWCRRLFDALHIGSEEQENEHLLILRPDPQQRVSSLPGLKEEGLTVTWDRSTALAREDVAYLSWEHPLVQACVDLFTHDDWGNAQLALLNNKRIPAGTLLLEALYLPHIVSPQTQGLQRWMPQQLLRILVDEQGQNLAQQVPSQALERQLHGIDRHSAQRLLHDRLERVRRLLDSAQKHAQGALQEFAPHWQERYRQEHATEIARLLALRERNPSVREDEIEARRVLLAQGMALLADAHIRLVGLRLIIAGAS